MHRNMVWTQNESEISIYNNLTQKKAYIED